MIIFIVLLFLLSLWKIKPLKDKGFYEDYASIEQTRSINGICIILILLSHTFAKVSNQGILDDIYEPMRIFLGQFVVVPFLFYSGFGIMESIKSKDSYIKHFPKKRFLKVVIQFFIITIIYILLHLILQTGDYSLPHYILSFTGITTIGNGNWYILSTFVFYIALIICFNLFKRNKVLATIGVTMFLIALIVIEILLEFPTYYYSTTIFFAVGMFFSLLKEYFDKIVMKNNIIYLILLTLSFIGFAFLKPVVNKFALFYPIWCGFGMLMILLITMKIKIVNNPLIWLGRTTFFNITLQGIAQIVFVKFLNNNYLIYILVILATILLTHIADKLSNAIELKLKERELKKNKE